MAYTIGSGGTPIEVEKDVANKLDTLISLEGGGGGTSAFSVAAPTASATLLLAANTVRKSALITNNGSQTVYLGKDNTLTTSNGVPLAVGASLADSGNTSAWWGITASGTGDIRVLEVS